MSLSCMYAKRKKKKNEKKSKNSIKFKCKIAQKKIAFMQVQPNAGLLLLVWLSKHLCWISSPFPPLFPPPCACVIMNEWSSYTEIFQ